MISTSDVGRASDARPTGRPDEISASNTDPHIYLSTSCLHGEHGYCAGTDGAAGPKTPACCKFCAAPCVCRCHTPTTDTEETS